MPRSDTEVMASRPGSGGKMLRPRKYARATTPYDRLNSHRSNPNGNNWFSKLLLSPSRIFASGAGKVLSSVFGAETSSSSSSASSGADDTSPDDNMDGNGNDIGISSMVGVELNKEKSPAEIIESSRKEPHVGKLEPKYLIEQLISQETFSREECDRLTSIIKSRVVSAPVYIDRECVELGEFQGVATDGDAGGANLFSTVVMEAKKWLQDRKSGSGSEINLDSVTPSLKSPESPPVTGGETGSPVDVAKSYMKARPPWASPCFEIAGQRSASPVVMQSLKEDTLFSNGGNYLSPSMVQLKRDLPISGSWNINEEIRKVRSKATEEMLRSSSSKKVEWSGSILRDSSMMKIDWSGSALGCKSSPSSYLDNRPVVGMVEKTYNSTFLNDATPDMSKADVADATLAATLDSLPDKVPCAAPALISEQLKDLEGDLTTPEGQGGLQDGLGDTETVQRSHVPDGLKDDVIGHQDGDMTTNINECVQAGAAFDANGSFAMGASLAGLVTEAENGRLYDEKANPAAMNLNTSPHLEETCELLSEASMEVPNVNENDGIAPSPQHSSSLRHGESSWDLAQADVTRGTAAKRSIPNERQPERKSTRYARKSRGRGK